MSKMILKKILIIPLLGVFGKIFNIISIRKYMKYFVWYLKWLGINIKGTPVVTYKTGGSPESLDETCGKVVGQGDVDELYKVIVSLCNEKPFSKEACIARSKMFDKNERFNEYVEIYGGTE